MYVRMVNDFFPIVLKNLFPTWNFMLNSVFQKNVVCINAAKTTCLLL